ncbi:hypothetical protein QBC46DRAFT_150676 [Diplogelasinospora grovesii]|uniref:Uncharacterized protein n=1 Tax=Diplogelasinospora grovesii TaxID=303347 RepID=A0AAN6N7U6_9PEZI|nr:hypothetical protein QBC46DRAFT_150676 [Diplogelasinospora grovesii]
MKVLTEYSKGCLAHCLARRKERKTEQEKLDWEEHVWHDDHWDLVDDFQISGWWQRLCSKPCWMGVYRGYDWASTCGHHPGRKYTENWHRYHDNFFLPMEADCEYFYYIGEAGPTNAELHKRGSARSWLQIFSRLRRSDIPDLLNAVIQQREEEEGNYARVPLFEDEGSGDVYFLYMEPREDIMCRVTCRKLLGNPAKENYWERTAYPLAQLGTRRSPPTGRPSRPYLTVPSRAASRAAVAAQPAMALPELFVVLGTLCVSTTARDGPKKPAVAERTDYCVVLDITSRGGDEGGDEDAMPVWIIASRRRLQARDGGFDDGIMTLGPPLPIFNSLTRVGDMYDEKADAWDDYDAACILSDVHRLHDVSGGLEHLKNQAGGEDDDNDNDKGDNEASSKVSRKARNRDISWLGMRGDRWVSAYADWARGHMPGRTDEDDNADNDTDSDAESDAESDADNDAHSQAEGETDSDWDSNSDIDAGSDSDSPTYKHIRHPNEYETDGEDDGEYNKGEEGKETKEGGYKPPSSNHLFLEACELVKKTRTRIDPVAIMLPESRLTDPYGLRQ